MGAASPFLCHTNYRLRVYSLINSSFALFTPGADASKTMTPGCSLVCTIAVSCPLNVVIWGAWKDSKELGSPLAAA